MTKQQPLTGQQVIAKIREQTDTVLLAFSRGKDAVATWLELRRHFTRIVPYHMELVPGLEFVERSLQYFEDYFETSIKRLPHPSFYKWINEGVFQAPERCRIIEAAKLPEPDYLFFQDELRAELGLADTAYTASGVRSADSPIRLLAIKQHGAINHAKRQFFPVWDWRADDLSRVFDDSGVRLPVDYEWFGRSFDGIDYRFVEPLRRYAPRDYERVLHWFPLVEADRMRRQYASQN